MSRRANRTVGALCAIAAMAAVAIPTAVTATTQDAPAPGDVVDRLGPRGEIPVTGITDADVETLAEATGMSREDSRFILFEGSGIIADFNSAHRSDPSFGGVNVIQDGDLRIQLRVTDAKSNLGAKFSGQLGRSIDLFVGGRSAAELERDAERAREAMAEGSRRSADYYPYRITTDFEAGSVVVRTPPEARAVVDSYPLPAEIRVVSDATVVVEESASFAGTERNPGCTVGFAMQNSAGTHALMTSGHCSDTGTLTAYGFNLGNAFSEACAITDSQVHTTPATQIWEGFYNNSSQWTNIHAVAGGWYPTQNYFRRGRNTIATGQISDIETSPVGAGGDCGARDVRGFVLTLTTGERIEGGDSGGPMFLAYFGNWYLAGIASTTGPTGSGGRVAWRTIPAGWNACTAQFGC